MAFNHYAKNKAILQDQPPGWYIKRINEPTSALTFKGETKKYDHYYRVYDTNDQPIKYCKFQQLDLFSQVMHIPVDEVPVLEEISGA